MRIIHFCWLALLASILTSCSEPDFSSYIGQTEQQVIKREGQPDTTFQGHYGNPPVSWASQFGTVKSAVWNRLNHEVYCTFEDQNGTWVLIQTTTIREGEVF